MSILPPNDDDAWDDDGVAWREPNGFGTYLVSFLGHVKSFNDSRVPDGRILNAPSGRTLVVNDDGLRTTKSLASLVMLAWHEPAPQGAFTPGHLNGVRSDNRAVNLFWESRHQQNLRANRVKRTACARGHVYQGSSFFVNGKGVVCCRACYRAHWWASKLRRVAGSLPFDGRLRAPITVEVILSISPDGRFPDGPPPVHEVLITAARHHHRVAQEASRLAVPSLTPGKSVL